eukprot:5748903-Pyramimonas_sp.AAC.1
MIEYRKPRVIECLRYSVIVGNMCKPYTHPRKDKARMHACALYVQACATLATACKRRVMQQDCCAHSETGAS